MYIIEGPVDKDIRKDEIFRFEVADIAGQVAVVPAVVVGWVACGGRLQSAVEVINQEQDQEDQAHLRHSHQVTFSS